ncbi:MAG: Pycsar system effector family protein [Candidatus Paracaedibacter sp.]
MKRKNPSKQGSKTSKISTNKEPDNIDSSKYDEISESFYQQHHILHAKEQHTYTREYIKNADNKSTFFFSIVSIFLGYLNANKTSEMWMKPLCTWSILDLNSFITMIGLGISSIFFLLVIMPRLGGSKRGLIYFNGVVEHNTPNDYAVNILNCSEDYLIQAKLEHCYELSKICQSKYLALQRGIFIGGVSLFAGIIHLIFH